MWSGPPRTKPTQAVSPQQVPHSCLATGCGALLLGPWDYCPEHRPAWRARELRRLRIQVGCADCQEFWLRWWELGLARLQTRRELTVDQAWEALYLIGDWLDHLQAECVLLVGDGGPLWAIRAAERADQELARTLRGYPLLPRRREGATRVLARLLGVSRRTVRRRLQPEW